MSGVIVNHGHCKICGKAVPYGDETCSPDCATKLADLNKRKRRTLLFFYGATGLVILMVILQSAGILR